MTQVQTPVRRPNSKTYRAVPSASPRATPVASPRRVPKASSNVAPNTGANDSKDKKPDPILFQTFFKSVGPRTYAAQMKKAKNGNHYLVLTEGKRDPKTDELRKISVYLFSEDFQKFFHLMRETADWIKANPVDPAVAERQAKRWKANPEKAEAVKA